MPSLMTTVPEILELEHSRKDIFFQSTISGYRKDQCPPPTTMEKPSSSPHLYVSFPESES